MLKRLRNVTLLATAMLLLAAGAFASTTIDDGVVDSGKEIHALAHHQHGGAAGHIDVDNYGVDLVGQIDLSNVAEGKIADVGVHKGYAYLGSFRQDTCAGPENVVDGGVYVVDINDPANPEEVAFIPGHQDSFVGEGVQAIELTTASFKGDILVLNAEGCGKNTKGGFTIYNVTNPRKPMALVQNYGDFNVGVGTNGNDANDIHSAFAWDAGDKAYVVVVDDFETTDVDIFDITNPRKPKLVGEYDLDAYFGGAGGGVDINDHLGTGGSFLHDMVVKEISGRQIMLLSYWDGGYVVADVTNPAAMTYVGDTDFPLIDPLAAERGLPGRTPEGNAHQAEFTSDNRYIIGADEDFSPFALVGENTSEGGGFDLTSGSDTPQLADGTSVSGATVYVGLACNGGPAVPEGNGSQIALVERGVCTFTEKLANVEAAGGYLAAIVFNRQGGDGCSDLLSMSVAGNIPAFFVGRDVGLGLLDLPHNEGACRLGTDVATAATIGAIGDSVSVSSQFDGWGYVHLYQNRTGKLTELDQYAIPEAHDPSKASGFGDLSVHEVATSHQDASLAYLSYYSGGFRVIKIVDDEIVEVGAYIADGGNNFWGVEVFSHDGRELVAASDRDSGLWIFEYTGTD
jgi:hypothetical protein